MPGPYDAVQTALAGTPFARIRYVAETGSTNEDAAALLGDPEAAGTTLVAEHQSRGAGRKGRTWISRPGANLLFTTLLPEPVAAPDLWCVPFWTALAVRDALERCGVAAALHWPNDLLLGDRKLAGILCVTRVAGNRAHVACGVGINVARHDGAAESIAPPPAFCDDVTPVDRGALLREILVAFATTLRLLDAPQRVARLWEAAAGLPGRRYRIAVDGEREPFEAEAIALASGGSLVVERDGVRRTIALADARALR